MAVFGQHLGARVEESGWSPPSGVMFRLSGSDFFPGFNELVGLGFPRGIDSTEVTRARRFLWTFYTARIGMISAGIQAIRQVGDLLAIRWDDTPPFLMAKAWINRQFHHFYDLTRMAPDAEQREYYKSIDEYSSRLISDTLYPSTLEFRIAESDVHSGRVSGSHPFVRYFDDCWSDAKRRYFLSLGIDEDDL